MDKRITKQYPSTQQGKRTVLNDIEDQVNCIENCQTRWSDHEGVLFIHQRDLEERRDLNLHVRTWILIFRELEKKQVNIRHTFISSAPKLLFKEILNKAIPAISGTYEEAIMISSLVHNVRMQTLVHGVNQYGVGSTLEVYGLYQHMKNLNREYEKLDSLVEGYRSDEYNDEYYISMEIPVYRLLAIGISL